MELTRRALLVGTERLATLVAGVLVGILGLRAFRSGRSLVNAPPPTRPGVSADWIAVARAGGGVRVFERRCPHLGCRLNPAEDGHGIVCPCHGSRFDLEGKRLSGPAPHDLEAVGRRG